MLCPQQIDKASLRMESFKKIGAMEACAGPLDTEIISPNAALFF
jgi:hypothetical protein